jgi:hypothetical protein
MPVKLGLKKEFTYQGLSINISIKIGTATPG